MTKVNVQALYPTFMGEQNIKGIGYPSLFLRLGGCHIRCYLKTKGTLCDTPEALEAGSGEDFSLTELSTALSEQRKNTGGIDMVCLTGGDPLWRKKEDLLSLFQLLLDKFMYVVVETSGTIDWMPYEKAFPGKINWVVDWKTPSAGIEERLNKVAANVPFMKDTDVIKFVIADQEDFDYFLKVYPQTFTKTYYGPRVVVGAFWGADSLSTFDLFELLQKHRILGRVEINMQTHKMAYACSPGKVEIPALI